MSCTLETPPAVAAPTVKQKKKLVRRVGRDYSQQIRRGVQFAFLALNVWIGVQFYLWVRYYETGGQTPYVERPPGVEGWLPIASLMNLKAWVLTGEVPAIHPAGMFLLTAFMVTAFLFRKSFCSWLCPVGTVSEWLWKAGRAIFGKTWSLPRWADVTLRSLKYILLGLFLYAVGSMSVMAIRLFLDGSYGIVSDVKMMNFFRYLGLTGAVVVGTLVVLSVFIQNFWCRFLCPYGALLGLLGRFSPVRVRRHSNPCIDCAKCTQACPSLIPADKLVTVTSAECTGCYECVAACPAEGALEMAAPGGRRLPAWAMAAGVTLIFLGAVSYAQFSGHWRTDLPDSVYFDLIPRADEFQHP